MYYSQVAIAQETSIGAHISLKARGLQITPSEYSTRKLHILVRMIPKCLRISEHVKEAVTNHGCYSIFPQPYHEIDIMISL
jgi:hypothetical protein